MNDLFTPSSQSQRVPVSIFSYHGTLIYSVDPSHCSIRRQRHDRHNFFCNLLYWAVEVAGTMASSRLSWSIARLNNPGKYVYTLDMGQLQRNRCTGTVNIRAALYCTRWTARRHIYYVVDQPWPSIVFDSSTHCRGGFEYLSGLSSQY